MIEARRSKRSTWRKMARGFPLLLSTMLAAAPALAEGSQIGQIDKVSGTVSVARGSGHLPAKQGDPVYQSDVIETGADGNAGITFRDNSRFSIGPGSQLALSEFRFDTNASRGSMTADLRQGTLAVVSGAITHTTPGAMHIKTPTSILGMRGTTFGIQVSGNPPKERFVVFPSAGGGSGAISIGALTPGPGHSP